MEGNPGKSTQMVEREARQEELFSTPKKKPRYAPPEQSTTRRIKSFTQTKQKQSVSMIYPLLVFIWVVVFASVVFVAFQGKLVSAQARAHSEIEQCKIDFEKNRCLNPVKGLVGYCNQKSVCMGQQSDKRVEISISYSRVFGEIVNEFAQGMGLLGLALGLVLVGVCIRQKGTEKETLKVQFFDDQ